MTNLIAYEHLHQGHRPSYLNFYHKVLGAEIVSGKMIHNLPSLIKASQVLFSTCDDYFLQFFVLALFRVCLAKSTVGLTIRSELVLEGSEPKYVLKKNMLLFLRLFAKVKLITILPHWVQPKMADITDDWIYDPQFVDIPVLFPDLVSTNKVKMINQKVLSVANGRKVIMSFGRISLAKGAQYMMDIYTNFAEIRDKFLFVFIGTNIDVPDDTIVSFEKLGGFYLEIKLGDGELISLYDGADYVWCCYDPLYNQSSGFFGRAIQLGKKTIVRKNSYLDDLQKKIGDGLALEYANLADALSVLSCESEYQRMVSENMTKLMSKQNTVNAQKNINKLKAILGVSNENCFYS